MCVRYEQVQRQHGVRLDGRAVLRGLADLYPTWTLKDHHLHAADPLDMAHSVRQTP